MKILRMYGAKGTYYCCSAKIFAIYPNMGIISTAIDIKKKKKKKKFPLYIKDRTSKLVVKPL